MKNFVKFFLLFGFWLLMSGIFNPLLIIFGLSSVCCVMIIINRMYKADNYNLKIKINPLQFLYYLSWLSFEIVKANLKVTKIILSKALPCNQKFLKVKYSQNSDFYQVVFANSITLTPGTISTETEPEYFLIHALDYNSEDIDSLNEMDLRVTQLESGSAK
ncbi:Na+/H+ antiporter subunit E [bacterium]|nr:Na+/H+ antiporter subunit E [bacterium]